MARLSVFSGYPFEDQYGYARAVRVGSTVWVSGTTARGEDLEGDALAQARGSLKIIASALAEAGAVLDDVVRTVVYVTDMADTPLIARAHSEAFERARPASTLVQVAALTPARARVEFEVTAALTAGV